MQTIIFSGEEGKQRRGAGASENIDKLKFNEVKINGKREKTKVKFGVIWNSYSD